MAKLFEMAHLRATEGAVMTALIIKAALKAAKQHRMVQEINAQRRADRRWEREQIEKAREYHERFALETLEAAEAKEEEARLRVQSASKRVAKATQKAQPIKKAVAEAKANWEKASEEAYSPKQGDRHHRHPQKRFKALFAKGLAARKRYLAAVRAAKKAKVSLIEKGAIRYYQRRLDELKEAILARKEAAKVAKGVVDAYLSLR